MKTNTGITEMNMESHVVFHSLPDGFDVTVMTKTEKSIIPKAIDERQAAVLASWLVLGKEIESYGFKLEDLVRMRPPMKTELRSEGLAFDPRQN